MQYLYDEETSSLALNDIKFFSARRGMAVGVLTGRKEEKPVALLTSDGGAHWSPTPLKEAGVTLFFLNDSLGWMVTAKGLWVTNEAGRNWRKFRNTPKGMFRVWFLNEKRGFAVGTQKSLWETKDGGEQWTPVAAAAQPETAPANTWYTWLFFTDPNNGIVSGWSEPPKKDADPLPDWMEPDKAVRNVETPHLSITMQTRDAGRKWSVDTTSMFGRVTRIRFGPFGMGLALIEFAHSFAWPSEVYRINSYNGESERAYRDKNRAITDAWVGPSGGGYLAGIEVPGELHSASLPGKVKILRSADLNRWTEMAVDYRAVASRVTLALVDDNNVWAATDTGMILKLVP